jgi:hypothetical protein
MKRRDAVPALVVLGTLPPAAHAQPSAKVFRIGFLVGGRRPPQGLGPLADGMVEGLRALGYVEGQHFHIEARIADGQIEEPRMRSSSS